MSAPRVSVLLASRNGERHLAASLASLARQTLPGAELVAVDDGSTDGTHALLAAHAAAHPEVRVLRTEGIGLAGALALAASEARGELLARQDDDDVSHPDRLAKQLAFLDAHPEIALLGTAAEVIDAAGALTGTEPVLTEPAAIRRRLARATPFVHGSVVMRRAAYERAGGYRKAFRASQDYDLWLRFPADAGLANLPEPLYQWRAHPGGVFARARDQQLLHAAIARAFAEERRERGVDGIAILERAASAEAFLAEYPRADRVDLVLGELLVREGRVREARAVLARASRVLRSRRAAFTWWALSWPVAFTGRARRAARGAA